MKRICSNFFISEKKEKPVTHIFCPHWLTNIWHCILRNAISYFKIILQVFTKLYSMLINFHSQANNKPRICILLTLKNPIFLKPCSGTENNCLNFSWFSLCHTGNEYLQVIFNMPLCILASSHDAVAGLLQFSGILRKKRRHLLW